MNYVYINQKFLNLDNVKEVNFNDANDCAAINFLGGDSYMWYDQDAAALRQFLLENSKHLKYFQGPPI